MLRTLSILLFATLAAVTAETTDSIKVLAGSTAKAMLLSGIELPYHQSGQVLIQITEITPAGGTPLPVSMRVVGTANAIPGTMRASITASSAAISRRSIESAEAVKIPCEGWFVDNLQGKAGAVTDSSTSKGSSQADGQQLAAVMAAIDPTISIPNGQPLTFVFGQDTAIPADAVLQEK